jgi:putative transposase
VQYLAIRHTERVAEAGAVTSVGSRGDSYDNALAESFNGLYKAELIHQRAWRGLDDVEFETLEYIDWFNHRRLHGEIGVVPPPELEATRTISRLQLRWLGLSNTSLYETRGGSLVLRVGS